jgi:hypothetical protein
VDGEHVVLDVDLGAELGESAARAAMRSVSFTAQRVQAADRRRAGGESEATASVWAVSGMAARSTSTPSSSSGPVTGDRVAPDRDACPHLPQHVGEVHVALEALAAQSRHGHLDPGEIAAAGEEVGRVAGVGLDA